MDTTSSMKFEPSQLIQQHTRLLWETIRRAGEGITELRSTVQQLEAKNSRLDEHLATLQSEFSQLREENATLAEHASHTDELRSAFTQANATIAELNANLHDRDNEINRIAKELQQLDDLRSLNHTLQTKLNSVTGELELNANDKELLNFATEENASLLKKIDELNEKNIALLADVERLHHDQSESEKTIATLQQAIGALESVLGEERTAKVQLMRDAEELRTLRISSVALQDYADRQANAAKEYEEQLNEMTEKLFLAEKQNTLQSATIVDLEQALSSQQYEELFRERENQYNAQITALQQKVNELERQHESMSGVTNDLAHLKQQLEFATESYNTTKQLVHERDSSLLELQKQYKQSLQQIEQLTSKVHHIENLEMIVAEKDTVIQ
ncbi:MAG: hypothetical protein JNL32_13380, partial [Candidatus Kapabacteria bacterium]|nr:hypothetical protein [Candidatus Kapabacteria bacterium]